MTRLGLCLSPNDHRLGTPDTPAIRSTRAVDFVASLVRFRYGLPGCSPPCTDQTGTSSQVAANPERTLVQVESCTVFSKAQQINI
jgi:hypothetical protein